MRRKESKSSRCKSGGLLLLDATAFQDAKEGKLSGPSQTADYVMCMTWD